jgi:hypothetical protein
MAKKTLALKFPPPAAKQEEGIHLKLQIGALCEPIAKQLRAQKLKFEPERVKHLQRDADAYVRLKVRGLLNADAQRRIPELIFNKVGEHIGPLN